MADNDFAVDIPQYAPGSDPNGPGQPAYLNNNPGNIKFTGQPGAEQGTPASDGGYFAKFKTPEDGYRYLRDTHIPKFQNKTLAQHISTYAPPGSNNTAAYVANASKELGVSPETPVGKIDREKLAQFQVRQESQAKVRPQDEFDAALKKPDPDEFDKALAAPTITKPGAVAQPSPTEAMARGQLPNLPKPPQPRLPGTWDPHASVGENLSNQIGDVPARVTDNIVGMGKSAVDVAKGIFHHDTPADVAAKNAEWKKPLGEQVKELPVVGPAIQGQYGNAVGDLVTGAALGKAGEAVGLKMPEGVKLPQAPLSSKEVINQQILQKVNETAARKADIPDYNKPVLSKDYQAAAKPLTEALAPTNAADFQDVTSRRLIPLLKAEEENAGGYDNPKTVVPNMQRGLEIAKERNRQQFQPYVDSAEAHGLQLSGDQVATAQKAAVPAQFRFENPDIAANMEKDIDAAYKGKSLRPSQVQQFIETNNAKLKSYFDAKGDVQNAQSLTQAQKAVTLAQQDAYHDILYKSIDPSREGGNVAELQKRYGVLAEGSKSVAALKDKLAAAPTDAPFFGGSLLEKGRALNQAGKWVGGLANPADPKRFLNLIPEETAQRKLVRAMRVYPKESMLKDIPGADPNNLPAWDLKSPGDAEFNRQRGTDEQTLPPSRMDTDFRQQYKDLPVHQLMLKGSEPEVPYPTQRPLYKEGIVNPAQPKLPYGPRPGDLGKPLTPPLRTRPGPAVGPVRSGLRWNGTHFVEDD